MELAVKGNLVVRSGDALREATLLASVSLNLTGGYSGRTLPTARSRKCSSRIAFREGRSRWFTRRRNSFPESFAS